MLQIATKSDVFFVNEKDQIIRPNGVWPGSDDWKMAGAHEHRYVYGQWRVVRTYTMAEVRDNKVPWFYKNGRQRCNVVDRDHGTLREWSSPPLRYIALPGKFYYAA
jgi:hypothetical protein